MSQENVEILRAALAEVAEGDVGALLRVADPDVRLHPRPEEPGVRAVYDGWDGVWEYCLNWYEQWDEYDFEPVRLLDADHSVLVVLRERGRMQASDIEIAQEFSHSFVLRDGRIVEWRMYDTHEQALEAVGLRE